MSLENQPWYATNATIEYYNSNNGELTEIRLGAIYSGDTTISWNEIPNADKITYIGANAFKGCINLALTSLPANLEAIGGYAFEGCTSLEKISIPEGCTKIGEYCFKDCTNLTEIVTESKSELTLYGYVFYGCTSLETAYLPNVKITDYNTTWYGQTFGACTNLKNVQLGSKGNPVTGITGWACYGCSRNDLIIKIYTERRSTFRESAMESNKCNNRIL